MKGKYFELRPECQEGGSPEQRSIPGRANINANVLRQVHRWVCSKEQNMVLQQSTGRGEDGMSRGSEQNTHTSR